MEQITEGGIKYEVRDGIAWFNDIFMVGKADREYDVIKPVFVFLDFDYHTKPVCKTQVFIESGYLKAKIDFTYEMMHLIPSFSYRNDTYKILCIGLHKGESIDGIETLGNQTIDKLYAHRNNRI
jgi:hypothetical protein